MEVSLTENVFDIGDEPITVNQVAITVRGNEEYLDEDQVVDLINQLEYFLEEMRKA